jgi:hypothetical protein
MEIGVEIIGLISINMIIRNANRILPSFMRIPSIMKAILGYILCDETDLSDELVSGSALAYEETCNGTAQEFAEFFKILALIL